MLILNDLHMIIDNLRWYNYKSIFLIFPLYFNNCQSSSFYHHILWQFATFSSNIIKVLVNKLSKTKKQGKSEGFDSCDRPSNLTQIGFKSYIFQPVWPYNLMDDQKKTIGHLFYAISSCVYHIVAIGEFKLELQSGNAQFGLKSTIF